MPSLSTAAGAAAGAATGSVAHEIDGEACGGCPRLRRPLSIQRLPQLRQASTKYEYEVDLALLRCRDDGSSRTEC